MDPLDLQMTRTLKTVITVGAKLVWYLSWFCFGMYFHEQKPLCFSHKQCYGFYHVLILGGEASLYDDAVKSIALLV